MSHYERIRFLKNCERKLGYNIPCFDDQEYNIYALSEEGWTVDEVVEIIQLENKVREYETV